jgi:hypothetical protein
MRKAIIAAVAAAIMSIGPTPLMVAPTASADPVPTYPVPCPCATVAEIQAKGPQECIREQQAWGQQEGEWYREHQQHPTTQGPSMTPVHTPQAPPKPAPPTYAPPSTMPVQTPQVKPPPPPSAVPVQTPKINPPAPGAPRNASVVAPPKRLDAPPQAVAAAKAAPAARVNPATPPKPPTQPDFHQQVQHVVSNHSGNVDVVKADNRALVRPRHWDYVDYDDYHRPTLYNPLTEAMTFRYFYNGAYREVYVAAGGRTVLDVATAGVFPFTAVGENYLTSGSFTGGAWVPPDGGSGPPPADYTPPPDPTVYQDVSADVPADNQTVQVGQVEVVGHDDSLPAGSQDIFMLDDSTLAWGQVNDPGSGAQITVTKTQSVPGVGPIDNGSFLVALTAHQAPTDNTWWPWTTWRPWALGGVLAIAAGLVALGAGRRGVWR